MDQLSTFKLPNSEKFVRFSYDNDLFASQDENYTQGYSFEFAFPIFSKNPLNHLFFNINNSKTLYGLAFEHIGYTPYNYSSTAIQFGDRPFASAMLLKSFKIVIDSVKNRSFRQSLSLGLIGPNALGKEVQVGIHEITGDQIPRGWHNQIANEPVLNYELAHEMEVVAVKNFLFVQSNAELKLGNLFTNLSLGANVQIGRFYSVFNSRPINRKFNLYLFAQPLIRAVGYDAAMQGGLFTISDYTISSHDIERIVVQFNYGLILKSEHIYFEFGRTILSREFSNGPISQWGGFKIGYNL